MSTIQPDKQTTIQRPDWLSERAWPYEIRTALIGGTPIAFTDEGSGPALLLIHDGMCSYLWVHLIDRLRRRFRVVTLDFPGSGLSPHGGEPTRLETDSRLLEELVDHLALTDVILVVHDLGGAVGLGLAIRNPEAIAGLVLINTFAWRPNTIGLRSMLRMMGSRSMTEINSATNLMARATSTRFGVGRHFDREQRRAFIGMFHTESSRRRFNELMASVMSEDEYLTGVEAGLERLATKPALTIFGERNDPFRFQEKWREHLPDVEQMVIPGGYHFPMCDDPDAVAGGITDWHVNR